jgi:hypothetical protein
MNRRCFPAVLVAAFLALAPARASAHCDTLDGPVVRDARSALARGDITPALKWVRPEGEVEVRAAFRHALDVRRLGPDAQALADRFFFETLVRVHRDGEGAAYTGLKPAGAEDDPGIAAADRALETGSVDALTSMVAGAVERGIRTHFARAVEARKHADDSVERGREYVAAYVEFVHYAERLHADAASGASHAGHEGAPAAHRH